MLENYNCGYWNGNYSSGTRSCTVEPDGSGLDGSACIAVGSCPSGMSQVELDGTLAGLALDLGNNVYNMR